MVGPTLVAFLVKHTDVGRGARVGKGSGRDCRVLDGRGTEGSGEG